MKIAILTSGIMPVPAVKGGAVETLIDSYLEYNDSHKLHDITVFSIYHPDVKGHVALQSDVNHYEYIGTTSLTAKVGKFIHRLTHRHTYYHYTIDYYLQQSLKKIAKDNYDCIILENRPAFCLQLQGRMKSKIVYHLHNDFLNKRTARSTEIYQASDKILTVSDYIKRQVQTCNADDKKTETVYNGIDLAPFSTPPTVTRHTLGYSDDDFILAYSGRLIEEKGIMELVEAMTMLDEYPSIKLLVMGSLEYAGNSADSPFTIELRRKAATLGERICFTGYVNHGDIPSYLRLSDIAVVPSRWEEPFGLTVVEGMAAGLPVITTDRGGIPEIVTNKNAVVIPYSDSFANSLASAIQMLYKNKDKLEGMGETSRSLSVKFSKELFSENFFRAIDTL